MKTFFGWILAALALLVVYATVLPFFDIKEWWIRAFGFPRVQIAIIALIVAIVLGVFYRNRRIAVITASLLVACLVVQIVEIFPYTPLAGEQTLRATRNAPQRMFSLVVSNVLMRNRNIELFASQIRAATPDAILAVETDEWWVRQLQFFETLYPYVERVPLSNTYGMLLMSKRKLSDVQVMYRVEDSIPSIRATVELVSGETFDLYCLHPRPPIPGSDSDQRDAELALVAREVRERRRPAIVAGDLNDVAWSPGTKQFQEISGMLDPRVGRGMFNSFHAGYFFLRYPLDHIFHSPEFRLIDMRRLEKIGSDHFPIYISLSYEPERAAEQVAPDAEPSDERDAREDIREGADGDR